VIERPREWHRLRETLGRIHKLTETDSARLACGASGNRGFGLANDANSPRRAGKREVYMFGFPLVPVVAGLAILAVILVHGYSSEDVIAK